MLISTPWLVNILQMHGFGICRSPDYIILYLNQAENFTKKIKYNHKCQIYFSDVTASNLDAVIQINFDNAASFQNHVKISNVSTEIGTRGL